jgi:murein L,D-transpeptidase YcbB/YkuD
MSRLPLFVAASLVTLVAVGAGRAEEASPAADDLARTLANPVEMPAAAPEIAPPASAPTEAAAPSTTPVETAKPAEPPATIPTDPAKPAEAPAAVVPAATEPAAPPPPPMPEVVTVPAPAAVPTVDPMQEMQAEVAKAAEAHKAFAAELAKAVEAIDLKAGASDERRDRAAIQAFYRARLGEPVFLDIRDATATGRSVAAMLGRAAEDGLDPKVYAVEPPPVGAAPEILATAELAYAEAALRYARHAAGGRMVLSKISPLVTPKIVLPDPASVLAKLANAPDAGAVLEDYNPPHDGYKRLKARLAAMRVSPEPPPPPQVIVPAGGQLKPGAKDPRILALRQRLNTPVAEGGDAEIYDDVLVSQVRLFQKERDLGTSGIVGPATLAALNKIEPSRTATEADVIVNMERWRWLPRDLGRLNVFVNVAGYYLDINRNGKPIHHTRVIVGRPANQTPLFSETMTYINVNPYWNVPVSILKKEMLGDIQATGGASLDRGNYEVLVNDRVVASNAVDWVNVDTSQVRVRQRPGGGNALGNVKFMFPNQHSVYLHDTSSRSLFSQDARSLSHGCVRVFEPFAFANKLLTDEPDLTGDKIKAMVGGEEKTLWLKVKPVVHLTYFTTVVEDDGRMTFRRDIYGHDQRMKQLLGLSS